MSLTKELALTASDVCLILETCAKTGVAEMKFGPLWVVLGKKTEHEAFTANPEQALAHPPATEIAATNHIEQTKEAIERDELKLKEDEIMELQITDPLIYEQLICSGELIEDDERLDEAGE